MTDRTPAIVSPPTPRPPNGGRWNGGPFAGNTPRGRSHGRRASPTGGRRFSACVAALAGCWSPGARSGVLNSAAWWRDGRAG
jgi:hypothetical protein